MYEIKMQKVTEKRINALRKLHNPTREQLVLIKIYDELLSRVGCYGATIEELNHWGIDFYADIEIPGIWGYVDVMCGLSCAYPEYIYYADTHGLNSLNIKDFNKLVRAIA